MKLASLFGVMVLAGALGAMAGGAVSLLGQRGGDDGGNAEVLARLDEIRKDVDGLRDAVRENKQGVGDLEDNLIAAKMDLDRMLGEARDRAAAAPPSGFDIPIVIDSDTPGLPAIRLGTETLRADVEKAAAAAAEAAEKAAEQAQKRFARSMELRALPEEERWRKAEEELGLTTAQTDEIKAAKDEFDAAMKDAITSTSSTTTDGASMTFRRVDGNKLRAARQKLDDRVGRVLNSEQKERWEDEGWKGALTGGGGALPHMGGIRRRDGAPVISTGVISVDIETGGETEKDDE